MLKKILPFLYPIVVFLILAFAYNSPILSGKVLVMHDTQMAGAAAKEINDYHDKTGEWSAWTNSMFGGMPAFLIKTDYPYSLMSKMAAFVSYVLPNPVNMFFFLMLGFYLFAMTSRWRLLTSSIFSIAFALGTYNLLYMEAGHVSKILALAFLPGILAGMNLIFNKKYLWGIVVTSLFIGFELYASHFQITYYFVFVGLAYFFYMFFQKNGGVEKGLMPKVILSFLAAVVIGISSHGMRFWSLKEYTPETTRGTSELSSTQTGKDGLNKDYAFGWSYGLAESLTLVVPNFMGGPSVGELGESSELSKTMSQLGVPRDNVLQIIKNVPLYFGTQPITSGPAYSGILVVFLFLLGLFLTKNKLKWYLTALLAFFLVLSWGSNAMAVNTVLFEYLPGYSKFRAVTMVLVMIHLILVWGAALCFEEIIENKPTFKELVKPVSIITGSLFLLIFVVYLNLDFSGSRDSQLLDSFRNGVGESAVASVQNALFEDRSSKIMSDIFRGFALILALCLGLYLFIKGTLNNTTFILTVGFLFFIDLFFVGKRFFNNSDYSTKFQVKNDLQPKPIDEAILQDPALHYRVLNLTTSFTQDAADSYFHKSIGGYHGAKLKRFQEVLDDKIVKDGRLNPKMLNALNTKYFIVQDNQGNPSYQLNQEALGNAWWIQDVVIAENADIEFSLLDSTNIATSAVIDKRYEKSLSQKSFTTDSSAIVKLIDYAPNTLTYETRNSNTGFLVFSEIFYRGNVDWVSYIDDQKVDHLRVDYLLRGIEVPAGSHKIKFEFRPVSIEKGKYIDLTGSLLFVALLLGAIFFEIKNRKD
ncbi:hypothetical protein SAMN06298216_4362 [Spirosomataceae bacterium TFI 002]|nr:hypothetical protein SAMN06298216_4362 [Spirosomataceae bacterium TFI 002]